MNEVQTIKPSQPPASARGSRFVQGKQLTVWLVCVFAVVAGAEFRFVNLGFKLPNGDEEHTRMQIEGPQRQTQLFHIYDQCLAASALRDQNQVCPGSTISEIYDSCRLHGPFNPPLYFLLARLWAEHFGTTIAALRTLSALISLLEIPLWFLLGMTLFESVPAAAIITALGTLSPYHLWLSQVARPYSLWTVFTLASSVLLLRASRIGSGGRANLVSWSAYLLTSCLGLYTHISALRVLLSDIIYGCVCKIGNRQFRLFPLLFTSLLALLLFAPWLCEMNAHLESNFRQSWFCGMVDWHKLVTAWQNETVQLFLYTDPTRSGVRGALLQKFVLALEAVLALVFCKWAPKNSRIFLLCMTAISFLTLALPDLIWGGGRTLDQRYMMPVAVALQCIFGFAVSFMIGVRRKTVAALGLILLGGLVTASTVSDHDVSACKTWWYGWGNTEVRTAQVVNLCQKPVLMGWMQQDAWPNQLLSLVEVLRPDAILAFSSGPELMPVPAQCSDVFLFHPTPEQLDEMGKRGVVLIPQDGRGRCVWKVIKPQSRPPP